MTVEFQEFRKIPRWSRDIIITEKIDGTNGVVYVGDGQALSLPVGKVIAGSRSRWVTSECDNFGFARWVKEHEQELSALGAGYHFGEWWGQGINRGYGLKEKRFGLFNVSKWGESRPACCDVVPTLYKGEMCELDIFNSLHQLKLKGSVAAPGFMKPEGVVIYHVAAGTYFKKTIEGDEKPKSEAVA